MKEKKVMLLAGEASGDLHGARLVEAVKWKASHVRFLGMGGTEMKAAGVDVLVDAADIAVVGLVEVLGRARHILRAMNILSEALRKERPDLLILIDFPDFNLHMARKARWHQIPILYYISPQVWAWRRGRVKKIGALADRIAVILPFEKDFYQTFGIEVDFVGHPLFDSVRPQISPQAWRRDHGIPQGQPLVGILPGSRKSEIKAILPVMLHAAKRIRDEIDARFILPLAPTLSEKDLLQQGFEKVTAFVTIIKENRHDAMAACDAVMTASGTATLELAILGTPMTVVYRVSPLTYFLGRMLIDIPYVSLVNLIAGKPVVRELLQKDATERNIARHVLTLLQNREENRKMRDHLGEIQKMLGGPGASDRVAGIVLDML